MLEIYFPFNVLNSIPIYRLLLLFTGINKHTSSLICSKLGINKLGYYTKLPEYKKESLNSYISVLLTPYQDYNESIPLHSGYFQENLKEHEKKNIERLKKIKCNRGRKHKLKLPVRGQRTRSNAKTIK